MTAPRHHGVPLSARELRSKDETSDTPDSRLRWAHKLNGRAVAAGTGLHTYSSVLQVQYRTRHDERFAESGRWGETRIKPRMSRIRMARSMAATGHAALRSVRHEYVCSHVLAPIAGAYHADAPA